MKKILIVDDEENSRLYLAQIVKELRPDYELLLASTPTEALFHVQNQAVDLLFLDVEMPGMSGLELLSEIRKRMSCVHAVFVSAYKVADYIQKAMRLNAVDYLDKPVNPNELQIVMHKCFEKSAAQLPLNTHHPEKLKLYTEKGDMVFCADEIVYFKSTKRYSTAHFKNGAKDVVVRENLVSLEKTLPETTFLRVGRQYIINTQYVKFVSKSNRSIVLAVGDNQIIIGKVFPEVFSKISE